MLKVHNNLSRQKEVFTPIDSKNVRMYVCGMTVYDYCHIGHARVLVVFDVVYRYLCHLYGSEHVTYIRNITDIDDKIIHRANNNGEDFTQLTSRFIDAMHEDADLLGVLRPNEEPRATLYMQQIIDMIGTLVDKGYAYAAGNGDVYYDVSKFA
ncbi:MAG: cysteine--tRNA ligase, partial [Gammaproteobacteria bacterium]